MIHYVDCTYCMHRKSYFGKPKRKGGKAPETEICGLGIMKIPGPWDEKPRFCEHFQVEDCDCELCLRAQKGLTNE